MPTISNRRPVRCPFCGSSALLVSHDHYVDENPQPVARTRELVCANGCQPTDEQLSLL